MTNRPGRPTPTDDDIAGRRDELVHFLSVWWADIARGVTGATTREQFRKTLEALTGKDRDHLISHFVRTSEVKTTGKEVRATRRAHGKAARVRFAAYSKHESVARLHSQIKLAMTDANPEQRKILQADLETYEAELIAAARELDAATTREGELQTSLEMQEASFSQKELADIVLEERCARNPLRLADAMAGLPHLSARVSYQRCSKIKCVSWPQFQFRVVKFIESTWNRRQRYSNLSIVELFDQEIKRLPKKVRSEELPHSVPMPKGKKRIDNYLRTYLGENRRYLRLAIEKSLDTRDVHQDEMPFVIASSFSAILGEPRMPLILALAERERIDK